MKKLIIILLPFILCSITYAQPFLEQSVINSTGGSYTEVNTILSYNVGEAFTGTNEVAEIILTQGFLQTHEEPTNIKIPELNTTIEAYPNPVESTVNIKLLINDGISEQFNFKLVDNSGKILNNKENILIHHKHSEMIDLSDFPSGNYFFIVSNKKIKKMIKMVKVGSSF